MNVSISAMTPGDLDEALALWNRTEGVGLNESDTLPRLSSYLLRNPGLSRVARMDEGEAGSRLVGAVLCGHDGRRGYLHHLAVDAVFRGRGIGRTLVAECLTELARIEITRCNLFLYADNAAGEAFWNSLGWRRRGELCLLQRETAG
jgi:putative acetyltransferase